MSIENKDNNGTKKRLSQTLGQIKQGYAVDTFQGGFPVMQVFNNPLPATASATAVAAATTLGTGVEVLISGGDLTDPDVYRNLTVKGNAATVYGYVEITGHNWGGVSQTERILASGSGIIEGNLPFKTVELVKFPPRVAASNSISVGVGDSLGLYRPIVGTGVELLEVDGVEASITSVSSQYGTITPADAPDDVSQYKIHYLTDVF